MRIPFRTGAIPLIATLLLVALGVTLGRWQDGRAEQKLALAARIAAANAAAPLVLHGEQVAPERALWRRIAVTGTFVRDWPVYLDNRPNGGRAGFVLLMPFRIGHTATHVLVARGWLPRDPQDRERIAAYPTPPGVVTIEGLAKPDAGRLLQLGEPASLRPHAIVQNALPEDVARATGLAFEPFVIQQTSADGSEGMLVRDWPAPDLGVDKHRGYAFQWYALAVTAFLFFLVSGFRRGRKTS
ncbi:cytochrome oxidase assembly protein ShyY1 [Pseudoduganella lurida]|uniref:SURF1-like protein n=1 Tax=Pseudoduganella lurida TaxID=1036180 RepID=A0A562R4S0_9BURK|nr:SURF1 family protein [Pseudoduganella lurida]TWI63574.1 cytochrome oxidase assembly protein ShyY1 [Pseudoduganella lurida]